MFFVQFVPVCRNAGSLIGNVAEYKIDIGSVNGAVAVDVQLGQQSGFDLRIFREGVIVIAGTVICTIQHYHVNICGVHPTIAVCIAYDLREIFVRGYGGCGGSCGCRSSCACGGGSCGC